MDLQLWDQIWALWLVVYLREQWAIGLEVNHQLPPYLVRPCSHWFDNDRSLLIAALPVQVFVVGQYIKSLKRESSQLLLIWRCTFPQLSNAIKSTLRTISCQFFFSSKCYWTNTGCFELQLDFKESSDTCKKQLQNFCSINYIWGFVDGQVLYKLFNLWVLVLKQFHLITGKETVHISSLFCKILTLVSGWCVYGSKLRQIGRKTQLHNFPFLL